MKKIKVLLFLISLAFILVLIKQWFSRNPQVFSQNITSNNQNISQWIDLSFTDYENNLKEIINYAGQEKNILQSKSKNLAIKTKIDQFNAEFDTSANRIIVLDNSIKILKKNLDRNKAGYLDTDKNNRLSSQEFHQKTGEISKAVYSITHSVNYKFKPGIYDSKWNKITSSDIAIDTNQIQVWIEAGIYDQLTNSLILWKQAVEKNTDYKINFYLCNDCAKEQIKSSLITGQAAGIIIIGDLPSAWYRITCWNDYYGEEIFPVDLYYMDLNGIWSGGTGTEDSPFTGHSGEKLPELIFGRLTAPTNYGPEEIVLIKNYLSKNQQYRNETITTKQKALFYSDETSLNTVILEKNNRLGSLYELNLITDSWNNYNEDSNDYIAPFTEVAEFKSKWNSNYQFLSIKNHGNPLGQAFMKKGGYETLTSLAVKAGDPKFSFFSNFSCGNGRFTELNYMAGWYVFSQTKGLASLNTTKIGGWVPTEKFYTDLKNGLDLGTALKNRLRDGWLTILDPCWDYGVTLIGDPTLTIKNMPVNCLYSGIVYSSGQKWCIKNNTTTCQCLSGQVSCRACPKIYPICENGACINPVRPKY